MEWREGRDITATEALAGVRAELNARDVVGGRTHRPSAGAGGAMPLPAEGAAPPVGLPAELGPTAVARAVVADAVVALRQLVERARRTGDLGASLPPMHQQRGVRRWLARVAARAVINFSRFLLRDQRATNQDALTALEHAADAIERLAGAVADAESRAAMRLADEAAARTRTEAAVRDAALRQEGIAARFSAFEARSGALEARAGAWGHALASLETRSGEWGHALASLEAIRGELAALAATRAGDAADAGRKFGAIEEALAREAERRTVLEARLAEAAKDARATAEAIAGERAGAEQRWERLADEWRHELASVRQAGATVREEVGGLAAMLSRLASDLASLPAEVAAVRDAARRDLDALAARLDRATETSTHLDRRLAAWEHGGVRQSLLPDLDRLVGDITRDRERADAELLGFLRATEHQLGAEVARLRSQLDATAAASEEGDSALRATLAPRVDDLASRLDAVATDVAAGARRHAALEASETSLDRAYAEFEARFRGERPLITARLEAAYGRLLHAYGDALAGAPWIDLGCGRGEWLDVLVRHGIAAIGVDANAGMLAAAREAGREVVADDALAFLQERPDASAAAVSALHVAEHLAPGVLLALLVEARRVVRPDGLLLLETPNPENVQVGAHTFHLDPTHRRPLPPMLLAFLVEQAGWTLLDVPRLHPDEVPLATMRSPEPSAAGDSAMLADLRRVGQVLFGPRDYAVIARRPHAPSP